jgi:hypothetical protein
LQEDSSHNEYYGPCPNHAKKECYTVLILQIFLGAVSTCRVPDATALEPAGQDPLEQALERQALSVELRAAVMACLSGGESRRWTISELVERFKNLGISASRGSVTAALAEVELELELAPWAP